MAMLPYVDIQVSSFPGLLIVSYLGLLQALSLVMGGEGLEMLEFSEPVFSYLPHNRQHDADMQTQLMSGKLRMHMLV